MRAAPMRAEADVLVIGSGAAGMYAAIEAARLGASVLLADRRIATLKDLLPGFTVAERGGVVRLAELQSQGYVYLRP